MANGMAVEAMYGFLDGLRHHPDTSKVLGPDSVNVLNYCKGILDKPEQDWVQIARRVSGLNREQVAVGDQVLSELGQLDREQRLQMLKARELAQMTVRVALGSFPRFGPGRLAASASKIGTVAGRALNEFQMHDVLAKRGEHPLGFRECIEVPPQRAGLLS